MKRTAYDLHQAAQKAMLAGMHQTAAELFYEAAELALTPAGAMILLEKAHVEACIAEQAGRVGCQRFH